MFFDFDVASLTFTYDGRGGGGITAELLDASGSVLDSFVLGAGTHAGTTTLDGLGGRQFRFRDQLASTMGVDDLIITAVPEPSSAALAVLALVALSRRRAAQSAR